MTQPHILELAKQGDPNAIATLMNQSLHPRGMTARVDRQGEVLEVILEAERVPNKDALTAFVQKGINNLSLESIRSVRIVGRQIGTAFPEWIQELQLENEESSNDKSIESEPFLIEQQQAKKLVLRRQRKQAQYFAEDLGNSIQLDMVLIPGGSFLMGSPEEELERYENESPQHLVTLPTFFMGKYAVTQAQWQAVAALPKVDRDLNPDPAHFKGVDHPVERISWHEAIEFCARLAQHTGRPYRLPSESEWEYACRAGSSTPFYFGETITTELANYCGEDRTINDNFYSGSYGRGSKGVYREETTPVGSFPANAFGLFDMHGNVLEWCEDHWHSNYENAPVDGTAWLDADADEEARHVLRGGSWLNNPRLCRSASRGYYVAGVRDDSFGFRVVCSAPRTL
jgi:formylglycine-generating enzyme required for sulfatase activity